MGRQRLLSIVLDMKDTLFEDRQKPKTMPPNLVNLHSSLFACYSQSEDQNASALESSTPQIGVSVSYFDDDTDVVTNLDQLAINKPKILDNSERRSSNTSDATIR